MRCLVAVIKIISDAQGQHGLKYGDYQRCPAPRPAPPNLIQRCDKRLAPPPCAPLTTNCDGLPGIASTATAR